ncbi:MAG: preprotein translocase subunit SecG [Clostridia bacterium]
MGALGWVVQILYWIVSLAIVLIVLLQSGKSAGLSGAIAGGAETFFGKNKGRTLDGLLGKLTTVVAVAFIILSVVLYLIQAGKINM